MSDETYDPWATAGAEEPPPADPEADPFDDILAEFDLEETESGEAIRVRDDSGKKYDNPYDVGLAHGMWVPIRIQTAKVQERHVPRLSSKICVAMKDGKLVGLKYDDVEKATKEGASEVVKEVPMPYFVCLANHASTVYGQRRYPYEIAVPVFTVKTAYFKSRNDGSTGFRNDNGRSLRLATGATTAGEVLSQKDPAPEGKVSMHEAARKMVDTIVLAQISIPEPKRTKQRPVRDADGRTIGVLADPNTGDAIILFRQPDKSGFVNTGTGEVWEGDVSEELLYEVKDNHFAIRDGGDMSTPLMEEYTPVTDYINPPFLPLPERKVKVSRASIGGDEPVYDEGEITLDTVGAIALGNAPGVRVDILLTSGENVGDIVTATWVGTEWVEKPAPKADKADAVAAVTADDFSAEQERALAGM